MDQTKDFAAARERRQLDDVNAQISDALAQEDAHVQAMPPVSAPVAESSGPSVTGGLASAAVTTAKEMGTAIVGGTRDAIQNTIDLMDEAAVYANNNWIDLRVGGDKSQPMKTGEHDLGTLPEVPENEYLGGKLVRGVAQFAVPFLGYVKALNRAKLFAQGTKVAKTAQASVAAAATNASAFDPNEGRLSNLILDMTNHDPVVGKGIMEFLAADDTDDAATGRMKQVLEGAIVDPAIVIGMYKGLRALRGYYKVQGVNPADALKKAGAEYAAEAEAHNVAKANGDPNGMHPLEKRPLQEQIDTLTGVKSAPDAVGHAADQMRLEKAYLDDNEMSAFWAEVAENRETLKRFDLIKEEKAAAEAAAKATADQAAAADAHAVAGGTDEAAARKTAADTAAKEAKVAAKELDRRAAVESMMESQRILPTQASADAIDAAIKQAAKAAAERDAGTVKGALDEGKAREAGAKSAAADAKVNAARAEREGAAVDPFATPAGRSFTEAQKALVTDGTLTASQVREATAKGADLLTKQVAEKAKGTAPAEAAKPLKQGDTVFFNDGESGVVTSINKKSGKLVVKNDKTGQVQVIAPDQVDSLDTAFGANREAGFANPQVLARLASGSLAGLAGFNADPTAPLSDRLLAAGLAAAGGAWAGGKAAKALEALAAARKLKLAAKAEEAVAAGTKASVNDPAHPVAEALVNKKNLQGISVVKRAMPKFKVPEGRVDDFMRALKAGKIKDLAAMVNESDFNLANIDSEMDAKEVIDAFSKVLEKEIAGVTEGVRTHDMVKEFADELGTGMESLQQTYAGTKNLDSKVLGLRVLLTASAEKVRDLSRIAVTGGDLDLLAARKQIMVHSVIQAQMKGVQTEVARALSAMRIRTNAADLVLNEVNDVLQSLGGKGPTKSLVDKLSLIEDPKQFNRAVRKSPARVTYDIVRELFINNLLWGPATHAANAAGGISHAVLQPVVRVGAAVIGKVRGTPDAVTFGETGHLVVGMMQGLTDAIKVTSRGRAALARAGGQLAKGNLSGAKGELMTDVGEFGSMWQSMATGRASAREAIGGTADVSFTPALSAEGLNLDPKSKLGFITDTLGSLLRVPTERLIGPMDELFWTMNYRGELSARAYRQAAGEGLKGDALTKRAADLIDSPTDELRVFANDAGRKGTFAQPLDGVWRSAQQVARAPGVNLLVPFFRTPVNLLRTNMEMTPGLGVLTKSWRDDVAAGGARADIAWAKWLTGGALFATALTLARSGNVTGGFERNKSAELVSGQQDYSFHFDGKYYSFARLDPAVAWFFGTAGDLHRLEQGGLSETTRDKLHLAVVAAMSQYVMNKAALQTITDVLAAATDPYYGNGFEKALEGVASGMVPGSAAFKMLRKDQDPLLREVDGMFDAARNTLPGLSKTLEAKYDIFGEPRKNAEAFGPDWGSPIKFNEDSKDPAKAFIGRLNADLKPPQRTVDGGGGGRPSIELTPKQFSRYQVLAGKEVKISGKTFPEAVAALAQRWPDVAKRDDGYRTRAAAELSGLHNGYKERALYELSKEFKDLGIARRINQQNVINALRGQATQAVPKLIDEVNK